MDIIIEMLEGEDFKPQKAHQEDACWDIFATGERVIPPLQTMLIHAGFKIKLPEGYEAQIRPRSGNALKKDIKVILGTIDSGYTGEIGVIVFNSNSKESITIPRGFKVAQMAIQKIPEINLVEGLVEENTARGSGGFGSSGE